LSKLNSVKAKEKKAIRKIAYPPFGEIHCLNEMETRLILDEIVLDKLYFQEGVSISPGDIVLDVGANIGVFALCAAQQGAHVYAYEPIPASFELLQQNIHLHGLANMVHPRNIGLSDRSEEKIMFHHPSMSIWDSWNTREDEFELMAENLQDALGVLKTAAPVRYRALKSLGFKSLQQFFVRDAIKKILATAVRVKCQFDTLSGAILQDNIQSIALLKLDAELADWEVLNGVKAQDWERIRQVAMEVHVESDVTPLSRFFSERDFSQVSVKKLKGGTSSFIWATKKTQAVDSAESEEFLMLGAAKAGEIY
jgi:FkbM family methyltransferase